MPTSENPSPPSQGFLGSPPENGMSVSQVFNGQSQSEPAAVSSTKGMPNQVASEYSNQGQAPLPPTSQSGQGYPGQFTPTSQSSQGYPGQLPPTSNSQSNQGYPVQPQPAQTSKSGQGYPGQMPPTSQPGQGYQSQTPPVQAAQPGPEYQGQLPPTPTAQPGQGHQGQTTPSPNSQPNQVFPGQLQPTPASQPVQGYQGQPPSAPTSQQNQVYPVQLPPTPTPTAQPGQGQPPPAPTSQPNQVYAGQLPPTPSAQPDQVHQGQAPHAPTSQQNQVYPGQLPPAPTSQPGQGYPGQQPPAPTSQAGQGYPGLPHAPTSHANQVFSGQTPQTSHPGLRYPGQLPSATISQPGQGYPGQLPPTLASQPVQVFQGQLPPAPTAQPGQGFPGQLPPAPTAQPGQAAPPSQPVQRYPGQLPPAPTMQPGQGFPGQLPHAPTAQPGQGQGYQGQAPHAPTSQQNQVYPGQLPPAPTSQPGHYPGQVPPGQGMARPQQQQPWQSAPTQGMPPTQGYPRQIRPAGGPGMQNVQGTPMAPGVGMPPLQSSQGYPPGPGPSVQAQPRQQQPWQTAPGQGMPPTPGYPQQPSSGPRMPPNSWNPAQGQGQGQPASWMPPPTTPGGGPVYQNHGGPEGLNVSGMQISQPAWQAPPGQTYPQPSAQQQQKRLDPEQMPSVIGVMREDQQTRSGLFQTNAKGLLPPLVTTKFSVDDQGNASPRFIRSTMYSVPVQPDMLKQTAIPFALVVNPFESPAKDEQQLQWVDMGPMGPVRCIRCKAYMSPLMQFIDGGRRFQCLLCKATTEVPAEYFQHLDHTGARIDKWERPEICKGSYEVVATIEYCRGNVMPKEPAFIFVIDVSYNNVKSGLVNLLCSHMKSLLECLPSHTPVGFITYNSKVHFFNIDPTLTQPQMVIVPDVADMFMPLLTGFLVPRAEAVASIDILMEQIPTMFADTKETESVLGPAIQAGMEALKASERVGKLLLFHSSLPTSDVAPGKLRNREADRKLLGTDKEKAVLTPQSTYYNNLGQDCVQNGVSVDLYLFNHSYVDVATIGQVARITGGSVNKYKYFQADNDGVRIIGEVIYHLSRPIGFDAVMRVRTSTGVRPTDFHGHFFMANTTDVEIAAIDSNKAIAVEIKHDDKLTEEDGVYIQVALLYTSIYGQRRLRIHNLALNTCNQMADLYRNCELDTITNFLAKQCISKCVESTPQSIKEGVTNRCAQMLATYRKHCANPSMPGQLILPECLKLLPLYINCVLRSDAVSGTQEITPDDRSWLMYTTMTMSVGASVHYFYPKLIPVAGPDASPDHLPVRCSYDKLKEDSAFILENGIYLFLWVGSAISPDWLQSIFGVSNLAQINVETITELPDHVNSDESLRLRAFIRQLRGERNRHMRLTIVRPKDTMEMVMKRFLIEDRSSDGQPSYVDFLCHMHKEIRALLNQ